MQSFLDEVVQSLLKRNDSPENLVLVLPNKRAGIYITQGLAKALSKTVFAPTILSIDDLMESISGLQYAQKPALLLSLFQAYSKLPLAEKDKFYDFIKWANVILQDFNEIDRHLVEPEEFFSYLKSIQELNTWYLEHNRTKLITDYLQFWELLPKWYRHFKGSLAEKGSGYQGMVYREAVKQTGEYLNRNRKPFVFIGFNALTTAESYVIQEFLAAGNTSIYWDIDRYFVDDPGHDAGFFLRQYLEHWPFLKRNPPLGISDHFGSGKQIDIIGAPNNTAQAKYVGQLLRSLAAGNKSLDRTAVVLGDETLLNPLLNAIPAEILDINITMGYPLKDTPVAGLFSGLFALYTGTNSRGWYYQDVLDVLSHPYLQQLLNTETDHITRTIREKIVAGNLSFLSPATIRKLILGQKELLDLAFPLSIKDATGFIKYSLTLIQGLKNAFLAKENKMALEYLYGFHKLFNQLEDTLFEYPFLNDLNSLQQLYEEILSQQTVDFKGEPLRGLQIMGMLESRNIDFETVIITSVNEGILPAGKAYNSYIPFDMKRRFNLPAYKEKDAIYTYHFYRLLQRAKNVYLIYNTEKDVLQGGEKSRLLMQLLTDPLTRDYCREKLVVPDPKPQFQSLQTILKTHDVIAALMQKAETGFSPTILSTYVLNPIEFYKKVVLGIKETEELEEEVEARALGVIIHNVLEQLYKPYTGQILLPEHIDSMRGKIPALVETEFSPYNTGGGPLRGKNLIVFEVINKYIKDFLNMEMAAVKEHQIELIALEEKMQIRLEIPGIETPVILKGTVDRIDKCDNTLRVIDYKTGNVNESELKVRDWDLLIADSKYSKSLQLLCYALLTSEQYKPDALECGIITIKTLSKEIIRFKKASSSGSKDFNPRVDKVVLSEFREVLIALIKEVFNPQVPFIEKEDS